MAAEVIHGCEVICRQSELDHYHRLQVSK